VPAYVPKVLDSLVLHYTFVRKVNVTIS
jgi:hypothetical protein